MQTRRQVAMMSALNEEQNAILDGFRNLPVHAGIFAARYQKAAQDENIRKLNKYSEDIGNLRTDFASTLAQQSNSLRQELSSLVATSADRVSHSLKQDHMGIQIRIDAIEQDVLALKTPPKKETSLLEFLFVAFGLFMAVSYMYNPPTRLAIGQ